MQIFVLWALDHAKEIILQFPGRSTTLEKWVQCFIPLYLLQNSALLRVCSIPANEDTLYIYFLYIYIYLYGQQLYLFLNECLLWLNSQGMLFLKLILNALIRMVVVTELSNGYFEETITVFIMITLQMRYCSWQKIIKQVITQSLAHLALHAMMKATCQHLKVF